MKEVKSFTIEDEIYPDFLKNIAKPPEKLFYLGNIDLLKSDKIISMIGTRTISEYGKLCCENIIPKLVANDVVIVSGLALGVDAKVHETVLKNQGKTIAIVGSGLDVVYPVSNSYLWKEIAEKGLILSEYELGTKAFKQNFPERNRIIAGISKATVVIESKEKGGSLITASLALEYGRDVYAIPGDIFSICSVGCNYLLRDCGAKLLSSADEILKDFSWEQTESEKKSENISELNEVQQKIYSSLTTEKSLDVIMQDTDITDNSLVLYELMNLELLGYIKSIAGGKYKRIIR